MPYTDINEARAAAGKAHSEWWALYCKDPKSEETKDADEKSKAIRADVLAQFGKRSVQHPDCDQCFTGSVFGGPRHYASKHCRSGQHPHCTCGTCF